MRKIETQSINEEEKNMRKIAMRLIREEELDTHKIEKESIREEEKNMRKVAIKLIKKEEQITLKKDLRESQNCIQNIR